MCGIFGIHSKKRFDIKTNILEHRGPDGWDAKYYKESDEYLTFFHSRLEVIGLGSQGNQPFTKKGFNSLLTYNGEIYNYKEIRNYIKKKYGIKFFTKTDTEVLFMCLNYEGLENTLNIINGMFSFAYYNFDDKKIYLCRDNLGIKPMYYTLSNDCFSFTSEIKVFFEHEIIEPVLRKDILGEYLANGWVYEPDTLFDGVYKLESATYLEYDIQSKTIKKNEYWSFDQSSDYNGIEKIIKSQTISDVPVGIYFSGGYDSSLIALNLLNEKMTHFNLDLGSSEKKVVDLIEKKYDIDLKKVKPKKENLDLYDKLLFHMDEPISDPAIIPAYELAAKAKSSGLTVMLSGMGGDEVDGGYTRHRIINNLAVARLIPNFILKWIFRNKKRDYVRIKSFLSDPTPKNYFSLTSYMNKTEINSIVGKDWQNEYYKKIKSITDGFSERKKFYILDLKGFLSSHNLLYMDKSSMAASIEVRVPLLDKNFVSFMLKDIEKRNKFESKIRIKKLFAKKIEEDINIKKEGFSYPINDFILNEIEWNEIIEYFDSKDIFETKIILRWLTQAKDNVNLVAMKLWHIYTLFRWLKIFSVKILK